MKINHNEWNYITYQMFFSWLQVELDTGHIYIRKFPKIIMSREKKIKFASIHAILPREIFVMILKYLGFKSITISRRVCHYWNKTIVDFQLIEAASSKFKFEILLEWHISWQENRKLWTRKFPLGKGHFPRKFPGFYQNWPKISQNWSKLNQFG